MEMKMSQEMNTHYDYLFKVVLVGDEEDIKSSLLWAFTGTSDIVSGYKETIGVNFGINSLYLEDNTIKMQIWDISFSPRVQYLRTFYFKGSSGIIMVIKNWEDANACYKEIEAQCTRPLPVLLIYLNETPLNLPPSPIMNDVQFELIENGFSGIQWLAREMLNRRSIDEKPPIALYCLSRNELQETLHNLREAQQRSKLERLETLRKKRAEQLLFLKESLALMNIPVVDDIVSILSSEALFEVDILTREIDVFPLKCDHCRNSCKRQRQGRLCIIPASEGWSADLDHQSLLTLSSIYALTTGQLPKHVRDQINNILRCSKYCS